MEVDVLTILLFFSKMIILVMTSMMSFFILCWPINDRPTSKVQYAWFGIVEFLLMDFLFFHLIHYHL